MALTFKHSGDLGDIIYSIPTIKAMGGGVLKLDANAGLTDEYVMGQNGMKTRLNGKSAHDLADFLRKQPFIEDAWAHDYYGCDVNLNKFRAHLNWRNIADAHLDAFGLDHKWRNKPWLVVENPGESVQYVLHRSLRARSNDEFWQTLSEEIAKNAVVVGFIDEFEALQDLVPHRLKRCFTPSISDLAAVIAGCEKFIGGQSLPLAIAEGLKKPIVYEVYRKAPSNLFDREGLVYV